jgi:hypothetical protein
MTGHQETGNQSSNEGPSESELRLGAARQMLTEAAALTNWCARHWDDETDRAENGTRIHYAVDVDVVTFYSDPSMAGDRSFVFSDANEISEAIAGLTADFVLHRLSGSYSSSPDSSAPEGTLEPLILIPPHGAELQRVVMAISNDATSKVRQELDTLKTERAELKRRLDGLDATSSTRAFLEFIAERTPTLANLISGQTGAAAQMTALNILPRGRLTSLTAHPAFSGEDGLALPPTLHGSPAQKEQLLAAADVWQRRMLKLHSNAPGPWMLNRIADDAQALAALEWINADAVKRGTKRRLVLVTATQRILQAGLNSPASHPGFQSFGDAYLRDMRSVLGAKSLFSVPNSNASDTTFRVLEWMSVLFPKSVLQERVLSSNAAGDQLSVKVDVNLVNVADIINGKELDRSLKILNETGYRSDPGLAFPDSALAEWRSVVSGTFSEIVLSRKKRTSAQRLKRIATGAGKTSGAELLTNLLAALGRQVKRSFADLYLSTGVIGVEQLLEPNLSVRGLPALRFDTDEFRQSQQVFETLATQLFAIPRPQQIDLQDLYQTLQNEDESNYSALVIHAFIYASSGRWFSARTLCRVALLVVDALEPAQRGTRSGREAAYLMAVAERRLAISISKLELARAALKDALDRCVGEAEKQDPRFKSEMLAQDVTRSQMAYFGTAHAKAEDAIPTLNRASQICEQVLRDQRETQSIHSWVIRQAVTNGLLSALMEAESGMRRPPTIGHSRKLIGLLEQEKMAPKLEPTQYNGEHFKDEISDFVWLIAVAKFEPVARANKARTILTAWRPTAQTHAMLAFEKQRFVRLLNAVGVEPPAATA